MGTSKTPLDCIGAADGLANWPGCAANAADGPGPGSGLPPVPLTMLPPLPPRPLLPSSTPSSSALPRPPLGGQAPPAP
eukprot:8247450-Alexandrium_andersonii.AAC.1